MYVCDYKSEGGGGNWRSTIIYFLYYKQNRSYLSFQSHIILFFFHMSHELFVRSSLLISAAVRCSFPNWW